MASKCSAPKSVSVRSYERGAGVAKRKRKAKAKAARKAKLAGTTYYTCVQQGTGRLCGSHHRTMAAAVTHTRKLDKSARAHKARYGGPTRLWHTSKRTH
jgi:YHS domain-containing protein